MFRYSALIITILTANVAAFTQAAPSPSSQSTPVPKPATVRRTFDQFDLSSGILLGSSRTNGVPVVSELVDRQTYDGIARMVKYASQIESEYRSSEGVAIDPKDHFEPYRVLSRKLPALYRIMEMFRAGLLEQPVLTNPANLALLDDDQRIIGEMQMIVNSTDEQLDRNQEKLLPIAERYGAPTNPVMKRPLLNAMFVRLNGNFARLLNQVAIKK